MAVGNSIYLASDSKTQIIESGKTATLFNAGYA